MMQCINTKGNNPLNLKTQGTNKSESESEPVPVPGTLQKQKLSWTLKRVMIIVENPVNPLLNHKVWKK